MPELTEVEKPAVAEAKPEKPEQSAESSTGKMQYLNYLGLFLIHVF